MKPNRQIVNKIIPTSTSGTGEDYIPTFGDILMIHGDGIKGSRDIVDVLGNPITVLGEVEITDKPKFGSGCLNWINYFGNGNMLSITNVNDFYLGIEPWTFEAWVYPKDQVGANYGGHIFSSGEDRYPLSKGKFIDFTVTRNFTDFFVRFEEDDVDDKRISYRYNGGLSADKWSHIALVCSGGYDKNNLFINYYINGQRVAMNPAFDAVKYTGQYMPRIITPLYIGGGKYSALMNSWWGMMDEVRLVKGYALWNSDSFNVPSYPYKNVKEI